LLEKFYFSLPLIAGVLASCATACAYFAEHILALTNCNISNENLYSLKLGFSVLVLRGRRESNEPTSTRVLP
jgi:hypothetical protein